MRQFLPNRKTMFLAVPARSPVLGVGSFAVVRVVQDPAEDCRISVESRQVYFPPDQCVPPVTSRTWIMCIKCYILLCKSSRLFSVTDKAGAGMVLSSLVQVWQVLHQAGLAILSHSCQNIRWCTPVLSPCHYEVFTYLDTTGSTAV